LTKEIWLEFKKCTSALCSALAPNAGKPASRLSETSALVQESQ
jgi:hypothetical protein